MRLRGEPRNPDEMTDADILREVMNTVGRPALGADIRCVVSVSMLTEGWDANTVTHIMGVRAFGTQLLCEQVVGRGLRRVSYEVDPKTGLFPVEYADVLGVPFSFAQQGERRPQAAAARDPREGDGGRAARNPISECRRLPRRLSAQAARPVFTTTAKSC